MDVTEYYEKSILNYNITLIQMYLEPDDTEKIKEIFKRLNKNSYNLNKMEKQSTQLVEYDYMIIAKIVSGIVQIEKIEGYLDEIRELFTEEDDGEIDDYSLEDDAGDNIPSEIKELCKYEKIGNINKLLTTDIVFTHYDRQRQIALQYFLNIFACIIKNEIINRNVPEKLIIELSEIDKNILSKELSKCNEACGILLELYDKGIDSYWKNKTSFFTLSVLFARNLEDVKRVSVDKIKQILEEFQKSDEVEWEKYNEASRQGVNDKKVREQREQILLNILFDK